MWHHESNHEGGNQLQKKTRTQTRYEHGFSAKDKAKKSINEGKRTGEHGHLLIDWLRYIIVSDPLEIRSRSTKRRTQGEQTKNIRCRGLTRKESEGKSRREN